MPNVFGSLGTVWAEMGLDYRKLDAGVQGAISRLSWLDRETQRITMQIGQQFQRLGAALSLAVTTPLTLMGREIVATFAQFEQSLANAAAVAGATAQDLRRMEQAAREAGMTTVFSASEAADAMYYLASAGFSVSQQIAAMKGVLDLAAATGSDLAFSAETVAAALSQFGLEADQASRVANVLTASVNASQATIGKLADSLRYIGPIAAGFGYSIEQVVAALGLLYNAGFTGETAGVALRRALIDLANPVGQTKEAIEELGLALDALNPAAHSLAEILDILRERNITTAQATKLFGDVAGPAMLALLRMGGDALREMERRITGTSAATETATRMTDTLQGSLRLLHSAWQELAIALSRSVYPVLRQLVDALRSVVSWFAELPGSVQRFIVVAGALAATLGPLTAAFGLLSSALTALAGPAGVAAAAIAGLGGIAAALMGLKERADEASGTLDAVTRSLVSQVEQVRQRMQASDEAAHKLQDEINWLNRLLKPLEDVAGKERLTKNEADALKSALTELAQRFPWVDTAVTTTGETFRSQLTALQQYRTHLQETLRDVLEAKNIEAGLSLPRLRATLDALERRLVQARQEAQRLLELRSMVDEEGRPTPRANPWVMHNVLRSWGVELKPGQNLFAVFAAEVERRSQQAADAVSQLAEEIAKTKAAIAELEQAQRDYAVFRATGRLPGPESSGPAPVRRGQGESLGGTTKQVDEDLRELEQVMQQHRQRIQVLQVTGQDIFGNGADLRLALADYSNVLYQWASDTTRSAAARAEAAREWEAVTQQLVEASGAEVDALQARSQAYGSAVQAAIQIQRQMVDLARAAGDDWRTMAQDYLRWLEAVAYDEKRALADRLAAFQAIDDIRRLMAEPVVDVQKALQEAAQASQSITREFWESIREGLRRRAATPAEVAQAIATLLDSGVAMADDLRQELEREYDALLPQVTRWAVALGKAQADAYIAAGREYLDSLPEQAKPWFPDAQTTAQAVEAADRAGDEVTRAFWDSLRDGLRARGATAWQLSQALADLLESGRPMSEQLRAELEREYDALVRESVSSILAADDELNQRQSQAFRTAMRVELDEVKARGEQYQRAMSAWSQRYAAMAQHLIDQHAESVRKRLELERQWAAETRRIWADLLRGLAGPLGRPLEVVIRAWRDTGAGERLREPARALADQLRGLGRALDAILVERVRALGRALDAALLHIPTRLGSVVGSVFRRVLDGIGAAFAKVGGWLQPALANVGASLARMVEPLSGALAALAGPIGAFLAVLLEQAPQAQTLMQALQQVVTQLATALGAILTPLVPVVQVLGQVLQPIIQALMPLMYMLGQALAYVGQIVVTLLQPAFAVLAAILQVLTPIFQVLNPILYAFAVIVTTIWNTIADIWNSAVRFAKRLPLVGWLFSWLPELQTVQAPQQPATTPQQAQQQAQEAVQTSSNAGTQVVNLTGESRNLFVELLRPIGNLDRIPGLFDNMLARLDRLVGIGEDLLAALSGSALAQAFQQFVAQVSSLTQSVTEAIARVVHGAVVQSGIAQVAQTIEVTGQATFHIQQAVINVESATFYGNRISFSLLPDGRLIGRLLGRELQAALRGVGA